MTEKSEIANSQNIVHIAILGLDFCFCEYGVSCFLCPPSHFAIFHPPQPPFTSFPFAERMWYNVQQDWPESHSQYISLLIAPPQCHIIFHTNANQWVILCTSSDYSAAHIPCLFSWSLDVCLLGCWLTSPCHCSPDCASPTRGHQRFSFHHVLLSPCPATPPAACLNSTLNSAITVPVSAVWIQTSYNKNIPGHLTKQGFLYMNKHWC